VPRPSLAPTRRQPRRPAHPLHNIGTTMRCFLTSALTLAAVVAGGEVRAYDMLRLPGGPDVLAKGAASTGEITDAIIARLA